MSAAPTITHAQAAKLREVFKGEQGWAIVVHAVENFSDHAVRLRVYRESGRSLASFSCGAKTVDEAVEKLLAEFALAFPQIPGVPR